MTIRTSGRSALIIATSLLVCLTGSSKAADDTAGAAKPASVGPPVMLHQHSGQGSHLKKHAHRGLESSAGKKANAASEGNRAAAISPSVADANAQLASTDTSLTNAARAMAARAKDILQAAPDQPVADGKSAVGTQVVSADQLNDLDRALQPTSAPPAPAISMASAEAPAPSVISLLSVAVESRDNSVWERTSLIGKVFIGFGALLTMASAARMFMA